MNQGRDNVIIGVLDHSESNMEDGSGEERELLIGKRQGVTVWGMGKDEFKLHLVCFEVPKDDSLRWLVNMVLEPHEALEVLVSTVCYSP